MCLIYSVTIKLCDYVKDSLSVLVFCSVTMLQYGCLTVLQSNYVNVWPCDSDCIILTLMQCNCRCLHLDCNAGDSVTDNFFAYNSVADLVFDSLKTILFYCVTVWISRIQ